MSNRCRVESLLCLRDGEYSYDKLYDLLTEDDHFTLVQWENIAGGEMRIDFGDGHTFREVRHLIWRMNTTPGLFNLPRGTTTKLLVQDIEGENEKTVPPRWIEYPIGWED